MKFLFLILLLSTQLFAEGFSGCAKIGSAGFSGPCGTFSAPTVTAPITRQINQRDGSNNCSLTVTGSDAGSTSAVARVVPITSGTTSTWQNVPNTSGNFTGSITIAAGWYNVQVTTFKNGFIKSQGQVQTKVGCGDVFITAGQSNATNYYQPFNPGGATPVDTVESRGITGANLWALASDPQPTADNVFGSIVPALGNLLTAHTGYPVGFISTGLGNTFVHDWIPAGSDYARIRSAVQLFPANGFRAILWMQGENDASTSVSQASYFNDLKSIIDQSRVDAGWTIPWGIAVTETHPNEATGAGVIAAQAQAAAYTSCFTGANPDTLGNTFRSDNVHFNTTTGQAAHANLWYTALINQFGI